MICNSGGAKGADTVFENNCVPKGITVKVWSFEGHGTKSKNRIVLTATELMDGYEHIIIANKSLKRNIWNIKPYIRNLLCRNWYQIKNSEEIFAVGTLSKDYKTVEGGTGWAVQMAVDNQKLVYVFDQMGNAWFKYDYTVQRFIPAAYKEVQLTSKDFAGIGTRGINTYGIDAIKKLFEQ
jgi:hypothetical protein